jgi:hypothetical protein
MSLLSRMWFPTTVMTLAIAASVATTDPVESTYVICHPEQSGGISPLQDTVKYPLGA